MPIIKLSKQERRKVSLFFFCLFISIVAWLFFAFSNSYVYQIKTLLNYTNPPQNKAFYPLQTDTVILQIQGTGWQLLFSKLRINPQSVNVSLKKLGKTNYITFTDQLDELNKQFESNQKVVYVQPDTLYFDFSIRSAKKIPIKLINHIEFEGQHYFSGKVKLKPQYVTIIGPQSDIEKIHFWETNLLKLKKVSKTINTKVTLKKPGLKYVDIYPSAVDIQIPVDEFTEKVIEVPIKVFNNTPFNNIKLLPQKVKITFTTALSNYSKIDKNHFEAGIDLTKWKTENYSSLTLKITRFPDFCKLVKIEPQTADFIIYK
ncbi:MAG: CdaR family protein [Daejeonella sp.]